MKTLTKDNIRLLDLVREMRTELNDARLITDQEYADLAMIGSASARRLEDYDDLRAQLARYQSLFPVEPTAPVTWNQMFDELVEARAQLARCRRDSENAPQLARLITDAIYATPMPCTESMMVKTITNVLAAHVRDAGGPGEQGEK